MTLYKYRFKTKSVDDYRPLKDMTNIQMPYWCTGFDTENTYAIIICYLPTTEDLFDYWDDAYDIEKTIVYEIKYTDRFPKPTWIR